jgi:hypothetical protein
MKPARVNRELALKALKLSRKNIVGDELATKLKVEPAQAEMLFRVGTLIEHYEGHKLSQREWDVLKVIVRVIAQNIFLGREYANTGDIDFAAGKRSGWCSQQIPGLSGMGLVSMPMRGQIYLTRAGWVLAWETGLIKPNWKVPA